MDPVLVILRHLGSLVAIDSVVHLRVEVSRTTPLHLRHPDSSHSRHVDEYSEAQVALILTPLTSLGKKPALNLVHSDADLPVQDRQSL